MTFGVVGVDFDALGIVIGGKIRQRSGGLLCAYLPIARPKPSKIGTVALHRFIGGSALLSRLDFIIVVNVSSVFTWFSIIVSRTSGQLTATSDSSVFKQKLNRSDAGTPKCTKRNVKYTSNALYFHCFSQYLSSIRFGYLRSDFLGFPSSTQTAFGNALFNRSKYGTIFASCWQPLSRKYSPSAMTASWARLSKQNTPAAFSCGQ